jgi:hypothetical protein
MLFRVKKISMIKKVLLSLCIFVFCFYFLIHISYNSIIFKKKYDPNIYNSYSVWPKFLVISNLNKECQFLSDYWSSETNMLISLEALQDFMKKISQSTNEKIQMYYQMLNEMYDFKFESARLTFNNDLEEKLKAWLNNDKKLLRESNNQVN